MSSFQGSLRAGVAAFALAIGAACAASPALAQGNIALPSASLEDSLNALSRQSGVQILVDQTLLRGKKAPAIQAASSVETALAQLLRGSGLTWQKRGDAFLIVRGGSSDRESRTERGSADHSADRRAATAAAGSERAEADGAADIVVTGSHIARPETGSPMPINVVNMEEEARFGRVSTYDSLIRDPAVGAGTGPYNQTGLGWDNGISAVSLRGLGTNRTLTVLDGRRRVSSSDGTSAVDLNMIPPTMIDRIEIVTGGAAAVYGADAVTGVVNVITKHSLDGLHISATNGISQQGDANEFKVTMATGGKFAGDRGSFIAGASYIKTSQFLITDRRSLDEMHYYFVNPANTGPRDGTPDNLLYPHAVGNFYFNPQPNFFLKNQSYIIDNGVLRPASYDILLSANTWNSAGTGGDAATNALEGQARGGSKTLSAMARLYYPITDSIDYSAYFDFSRSIYNGLPTGFERQDQREGNPISIDNPFMPDAMRQLLIQNEVSSIYVNRQFFNYPRITQKYDRQNYTIGQSLHGNIGPRLKWEAFFQYGKTTNDVTSYNLGIRDAWYAAQDVIADPVTGQPVCRSATARAVGCVPFNIFNASQPYSQAVIDYTSFTRYDHIDTTQRMFGADVSGSAFSLPYGDLQFTVGFENRRDTLLEIADPRSEPVSGNQWGIIRQFGGYAAVLNSLDVSQSVTEAYVEAVAPLLKDLPFAHLLQIEGAYRFSHYNTVGNTDTWKAGAIWSPLDGLSFRGVRSRSVRAPNFGELYTPQATTPTATPADPCRYDNITLSATRTANCVALGVPATGFPDRYTTGPDVTTGGNPDLKPETSNSLTLGMIFQPRFLRNLDLTVDYWDIKITNVVAQFGASTIWNLCVDLPSINNDFCKAQTRDPVTHHLTTTNTGYINAQRLEAKGIDLGLRYRRALASGMLSLSFKGTYLLQQVTETTPGTSAGNVYSAGSWDNPHFKGVLSIDYAIGKLGVGLNTRIVGAGKYNINAQTDELYPSNHVPARVFNDISVRYDVNDRYSFGLGVRNVLNTMAPDIYPLYLNATQYDIVGRYFFATLNLKM